MRGNPSIGIYAQHGNLILCPSRFRGWNPQQLPTRRARRPRPADALAHIAVAVMFDLIRLSDLDRTQWMVVQDIALQ
jgi:hypothetical protein